MDDKKTKKTIHTINVAFDSEKAAAENDLDNLITALKKEKDSKISALDVADILESLQKRERVYKHAFLNAVALLLKRQ